MTSNHPLSLVKKLIPLNLLLCPHPPPSRGREKSSPSKESLEVRK